MLKAALLFLVLVILPDRAAARDLRADPATGEGTSAVEGEAVGDDTVEERAERAARAVRSQEVFPRATIGLAGEIEGDWTVASDEAADEIATLQATVEAASALEWAEGSGLFSTLVFEQVRDQDDDGAFEDEGLYVEELYAAWQWERTNLLGGKFDPAFGLASDAAPGIYGSDFADDYELTERLGLGAGFAFDAGGGEHRLDAATFVADTTALSGSTITDRGELDRSDGGPSNTGDLRSFTLMLQGSFVDERAGDGAGIGYALSLERQAGGRGDPGDEIGVAAATTRIVPLDGDRTLELLGEIALFDDIAATKEGAGYLTLGAALGFAPWSLSATYALRHVENDDHLATLTLEHEVSENASIAVGYRFGDEEGVVSHGIGALLLVSLGAGIALAPGGAR
ncbi:MAG: hypothetical protein KDE35_06210 [Geminicoccaceae bacterium]|nr:hypothetical protein [Geminicoccaceae bacterium]